MDCNIILNHIKKDLSRDDIKQVTNDTKLDCLHYKIAFAIDKKHENQDYHFYREDNDNSWSHKPGGNYATNLDASDNKIIDPATANRDYSHKKFTNDDGELETGKNYETFCGYYSIPINKGPILHNWDSNTEHKINLDANLHNFVNDKNWVHKEREDDNDNSNYTGFGSILNYTGFGSILNYASINESDDPSKIN